MQYYNPEDKRPQLWALLTVVLYVVMLAVLMFTINFSVTQTDPTEEGILVEFGQDEVGMGDEELAATDVAATPTPPENEESDEVLETDDNQDIEIEQQEEVEPTKDPTPTVEKPQEKQDTTITEQRVVNKKALFPGRKEDSAAASQGSGEVSGNQGSESGNDQGTAQGGGNSDTPVAVLKDRSLVGSLPTPRYNANAAGKVIIDISVDDTGRVKSATYRAQGSTTNNSQLVAAAREAALKTRFTSSDNFIQGGTITYTFKMN